MSSESRLALQRRAAREKEVQAMVKAAGAVAKARVREQSWQSGTSRDVLFDEKHFLRSHEHKDSIMKSRFKRLYAPLTSAYWSPEGQASRALEGRKIGRSCLAEAFPIEPWRAAIPAALSLDHPSIHENLEELGHGTSTVTETSFGIGCKCRFATPEPFDPTAAPSAFYSKFKQKLAGLQIDVAQPPAEKRIEQTPTEQLFKTQPKEADCVPLLVSEAEVVEEGEDASAIYLTSLNHLASCGIEIPDREEAITGRLSR